MAESLARAREAAEAEARLRQTSDSLWTPERLKEFVRVKLEGRPIFVVSNREPYQHVRKGKDIECIVPASGLVTAIEPVLKACGGTWIAEGNGDADRETVDATDRLRVPPEEPQYTLRRVWLTREEEEGYYYGFSNEGLWPLCHIAHTRPIFRPQDWVAYEAVNRKFARAVLEELEGVQEPCVLIQDYHFALLPALIKAERPDARVTIFWHIPWPNPESFGICPWQDELLKGMLGADIVGFHTQYHCNNFLQTVDRFLESRIDYEHFTVNREGRTTRVKPFPISIAFTGVEGTAPEEEGGPTALKDRLLALYGLSASRLGVGVDRIDYTKGILERFRSVEALLESRPELVGEFTFVELGAPSRSLIPKYQEFMVEVEREVERINARFKSRKNWRPILFLKKHHSQRDILPFYRAADVCMVTSLHDGMNLVAKEFVTARNDESGVLILSQFTGASRELKDALIINPYDIAQSAAAIRRALDMPADEKRERMRRMRAYIKERNIFRWAADIVGELTDVRIEAPAAAHRGSL
jgi:trehalose 6-phosphate synthase